MTRALLALLLAGRVMGAGDFTFNVTTNANNNQVVFTVLTAYRQTVTFALINAIMPGTTTVAEANIVRGPGWPDYNYESVTSATGKYVNRSNYGAGNSYSFANGTTSTTVWCIQGVSVTTDDAEQFLNGVSVEIDNTVSDTDNPTSNLLVGCEEAGTGANVCYEAVDSRGYIGQVAFYSVRLTAGEQSQAGVVNSFRRPFRGRELHAQLFGQPGVNFGTTVADWAPAKNHGNGSNGTDPTYVPMMQRGAGR